MQFPRTDAAMSQKRMPLMLWVLPTGLALALTIGLLVLGRLLDRWLIPGAPQGLLDNWLFVHDPVVARTVILAVLEVLAAIFAIMITVVAIIVQLSATRYTSRVVDLFLVDPFNRLVFFAYVVPLIHGFWLANVLQSGTVSPVSVGVFMVAATVSIILVIPYFRFVFVFLQPQHIIQRIETSIEQSLRMARDKPQRIPQAQQEVSNSIRQLSDIALSSIAQADIVLAVQCVDSMTQAAVYYLRQKERMQAGWFAVDRNHIVGLSAEVWRRMVECRTWMEMEVYKQTEIAFLTSLRGRVRDVNSYVARGLRQIAEAAAEHRQQETLQLLMKGLNTFITYTLSERDVRAAMQVLYQYRLLAETLTAHPETLEQIGGYLQHYARNSSRRNIHFIPEVIAYDLRLLIEQVLVAQPAVAERLLERLLELVADHDDAEGSVQRPQGLHKSLALLAARMIEYGRGDLACRIHDRLATEDPAYLSSLRRELSGQDSREFWEIEDRGVSFYYVEASQRAAVDEFFGWLSGERPLPDKDARTA